jgi:sialate O-acetylesterase
MVSGAVEKERNILFMIKNKMIKKYFSKSLAAVALLFISLQFTFANISIPEIFSGNMVLQRRSDVTFWGWAKIGETVIIRADWLDEVASVKAGTQGTWQVVL